MLVTLLVFILILGIIVFVHELGHFLAAKRAGIKVEEFAFGFRPRLYAKKIGETEYAINLIPLGGYVKLFGEGEGETGARSYLNAPFWSRVKVMVAGSLMNLILAWLIMIGLFIHGYDPLVPGVGSNPFIRNSQEIVITSVADDSPASTAKLKSGDKIIALNGQKLATDLEFLTVIGQDRGQQVSIEVSRDNQTQTVQLTPRVNPPAGQGAIGIGTESSGTVQSTVLKSPLAAIYETGRLIGLSAAGVGSFVKGLVVQHQVSEEVTGVIGIGELTGIARRLGFQYLAQLVAVITIGLGVINLVPLLPLDGGQVIVALYEKLARRKMTEKQLNSFAMVGLVLIVALFVTVTYKDIVRFDIISRFF